jgi:RNA-directed DNA polymerase
MQRSHAFDKLAGGLAAAFLAGEWTEAGLVRRGRDAVQPPPRWMRRVAAEVLAHYHRPPLDRPRELERFIELQLARIPPPAQVRQGVRHWHLFEQSMGRRRWPVAELDGVDRLAALLGLTAGELDWLADVRSMERRVSSERLRNYRYAWLPRPAAPPRVIEMPKPRLKAAQRTVLRQILDRVPAHPASHGFVPGRSARTHAAEHSGREVVIRLDLEDFFASVEARRVFGIFREAGYPEAVAHALTGLCSNVVPVTEWAAVPRPSDPPRLAAHWRLGSRLATPHLPQGAPTSPALANLAAFRLDRRLAGLAETLGARYTRYADDLVLSGPRALRPGAARLAELAAEIAREEGFRLNHAKTRAMGRGGRQQVCGVVVNEHPNVPRREYDELKAILHNAARGGPKDENRAGHPDFRAHLLGRIAWVEQLNPGRGRKLRERFALIDWGG